MEKDDITKEEFGQYVRDFLVDVGFGDLDMKNVGTVADDKVKKIASLIEEEQYPEDITRVAILGAERVAISCSHLDENVISQICILSAITIFVDDTADPELTKSMEVFSRRIIAGQEQDHPVLQAFVKVLRRFGDFFGTYSSVMITKSVLDYVASHLVEAKFEREQKNVPKGATLFPDYFRSKSFGADCLTHLMFPETMFPEAEYLSVYLPIIPEIGRFKSSFNDIISFYKETISGDDNFNYICNLANVQGISRKEAFQFVCKDTIQRMRNIETVLADHPVLLDALISHFKNHCQFYFNNTARYRLDEIPVLAELLK